MQAESFKATHVIWAKRVSDGLKFMQRVRREGDALFNRDEWGSGSSEWSFGAQAAAGLLFKGEPPTHVTDLTCKPLPAWGNGRVLWEGESLLDGAPIVVIATSVTPKSSMANTKTGDCIQTWIIRRDVSPIEMLKSREDASVCGDCPLRPQGALGTLERRACYVHLPMVDNIWQGYKDGIYRRAPLPANDREIRLGSFGDPAAVPFEFWQELIEGRAWFGYTHAWRDCDKRFASILMASADVRKDRALAQRRGWRTFRTLENLNEELAENEIRCPASDEGHEERIARSKNPSKLKKAKCVDCGLCDGSQYADDPRKSIAIVAHGWTASVSAYRHFRKGLRVIAA